MTTNSNVSSSQLSQPETEKERDCKAKLKHFFHGKLFHMLLTILIVIDLIIVLTDIVVIMIHCDDIPHHIEEMLHVFFYISVTILSVFFIELCLQMYAFGIIKWMKDCLHVFDLCIVTSTLIAEILLHGNPKAEGIVGLLIGFRLWRLVRVVHVTTEALDLQHEMERDKLLNKIKRLKHQIRKYRKLDENTKTDDNKHKRDEQEGNTDTSY